MSKSRGGRHHKRPERPRGANSGGLAANRQRFDQLVADALEEIPEPFRSRMENVAIVVEDAPTADLLASLGMSREETLLGFYDGIPLIERGDWYNLAPPDRIMIFRRPIQAICTTAEEIREQVRITVLHEIAHFYGIDDDELDRMGLS